MLSVCTGQVTHALLTRPPLFSEEKTYFYVRQGMSRLGKVLRVASN